MNLLENFTAAIECFDISEERIALAVSGGPDSLALMFIAKLWADAANKRVIALTVNHQLRHEAHDEAVFVSQYCQKINVEHHILVWEHNSSIKSNVQASARSARYDLMTKWCSENNVRTVLTAHHADDQIENFLIRLQRGSGLFGLATNNINLYRNIRILRPLFNINKSELLHYLKQNNIKWVEDVSNTDPKYLRTNIRRWIDLMPQELDQALFKQRILLSQKHLRDAGDYLQKIFSSMLKKHTTIHPTGYATYSMDHETDPFIHKMILSHLLINISGDIAEPRGASIDRLYDKLVSNTVVKSTLHGCIIIAKTSSNILICREFGKTPPSPCPMHCNIKWDNRWRTAYNDTQLIVDSITHDEYVALKNNKNTTHLLTKIPKLVLLTAPVIRRFKKIVAIPHIDYYDGDVIIPQEGIFTFEPNYESRLINS